jgi:CMP/dCMP kinase
MIVTVGGQAASGKSTLAERLSGELGFNRVSAGQIMRDMAVEHNMSLLEFSVYAENHPDIDKVIDERQRTAATGDCIVDGRLSRYFLNPDMSIWLIAPEGVRAERVVGRGEKYDNVDDAMADMSARDNSERRRYLDFYDIDLEDLSAYDLIINTEKFGVEEMVKVAKAAITALKDKK